MNFKSLLIVGMAALLSATSSCSQQKKDQEGENNNKILIAYFSATGTTKRAATHLAEVTGAQLYEITPESLYTDSDLDWRDSTSRSSVEMRNLDSRPAIVGKVENLNEYNTIFIGYPIWWYLAPTIINTFIENNDLSGKTVICFATSGGSPIKPCVDRLKSQYPDIEWKEGKLLNEASKQTLEDWKTELGL